jgi:hypothetical protein
MRYNKAYHDLNKDEDKVLKDKYGARLDKVEAEIDRLKKKHGFADPDDFPQSEGSDDE